MNSALLSLFPVLLLLLSKDAVSYEFDDDSDIATFVTRPEFRPPLYNVTTYIPESVTPGYWFTAPYTASMYDELIPSEMFQSCQVGPHIYDQEGNLVWSGACLVKNRPAAVFRVSSYHDKESLTMVLAADARNKEDPRGVGWILDTNFELLDSVYVKDPVPDFDMHEFDIQDNGKTALMVTRWHQMEKFPSPGANEPNAEEIEIEVSHNIFHEVDILSGESVFRWDSVDHVPPPDSIFPGEAGHIWDYFHMNSLDKDDEGNYLVSGRHTHAIYKVSGEDGSIIWQLGGVKSSFEQIGFNFSFQHDARFQSRDGPITIISYMNNASHQKSETGLYSTADLVKLDTDLMTATLISRWGRPDHELSRLRGNVQMLDNGNVFVGWSDNSYISEFTPDGEVTFEAQFHSHRFATYRTYKFNFTGRPSEPPVLKSFVYGTNSSMDFTSTVSYVSWNGATEVVFWNFYASAHNTSDVLEYIGNANKTGFETMFTVDGYMRHVRVEGIDKDGNVLGSSLVEETEVPSNWISDSPSGSSSDNESDKSPPQASVDGTSESADESRAAEVRIPLPIFIGFLCVCALGTIYGVVYFIRRRMTRLRDVDYHKIQDEAKE